MRIKQAVGVGIAVSACRTNDPSQSKRQDERFNSMAYSLRRQITAKPMADSYRLAASDRVFSREGRSTKGCRARAASRPRGSRRAVASGEGAGPNFFACSPSELRLGRMPLSLSAQRTSPLRFLYDGRQLGIRVHTRLLPAVELPADRARPPLAKGEVRMPSPGSPKESFPCPPGISGSSFPQESRSNSHRSKPSPSFWTRQGEESLIPTCNQ